MFCNTHIPCRRAKTVAPQFAIIHTRRAIKLIDWQQRYIITYLGRAYNSLTDPIGSLQDPLRNM